MNAQQLKNSILQEAIEGRLVPQDPNDEPASVLLDKIRKEKAKLVKEGKLKKKDLEETPISEDEKPFDIPESWEWVRFGTITINRDRERIPLSVDERSKLEKKYDYYGASGVIDKVDRFLFNKPLLLIGEDGANLINRSTPIAFIARGEYWVNNHAHVLDYINEDLMQFVCWYINAISLVNYVTGTAQPKMNQEKMNSILVALPPLAEQKRIVAKIEKLLPKVEEYGKAQERLDKLNEELPERLKKSILQEAIEGRLVPQDPNDEPASVLLDRIRKVKAKLVKEKKIKKSALKEEPLSDEDKLFPIPSTWEWCKLGWIGDWGAGATPAKGNPEFYTNGTIPWLRTGELNNGVVYDSELKVTPYALQKCSLRECKIGDVLIAMYGATIGKVAIAGIELTTNQACCACTPYQVYNKFLLYYLMASKQRFIDLGEGGAQPNISREKIVAFPFPLPPLAEQKRIVEKIEQLMKEIDKLKV